MRFHLVVLNLCSGLLPPPYFGIAFHVLHVSALFEQDSGLKIGSGFSVSTFEQDLSSL